MAASQQAPADIPQPSYASLGRRILAHLVDSLIGVVLLVLAGYTVRWLGALGVWTPPRNVNPAGLWDALSASSQAAAVIAFLVSMGSIYTGLFQASAWQASIGKRFLNIYVTDIAWRRLGPGRSLARSFVKDFFNLSYVGFVSVATIAASSKKQALHDFAAKTIVMRGQPQPGGSVETWRIVMAFGIPFLWVVVTFAALFRSLMR